MAAEKVVVVMGSPRRNGNSIALAEKAADGVASAGGKAEGYYLHDMDIKPCDACEACRRNSNDNCIIEDDMQQIYHDLKDADALIIASPIYWFTINAQTKLFMDRCYGLGGPQGNVLKGKKIGIILTYGDSDPFNSGCINALRTFQDTFAFLGAPIVDMVYGSASKSGEIKANNYLMGKAYKMGQKIVNGE